MPNLFCKCCGGMLNADDKNPDINRCTSCKTEYPTAAALKFSQMMRAFDAHTREKIQKLLRRRHEAVSAEYISSADLVRVCDQLLDLVPEDIISTVYKVAAGNNLPALNRAIREIDVERYYDDIDEIVPFLIASMSADDNCQSALRDLVERAYKKRDLPKFHKFTTMFSEQAARVNAGVYETNLHRDVFVAYSSKDMPLVWELVEELERQKLSCFVAARNLRHGVGSVENYDRALREAMDNCRSVVFVSTENSRNFACDAFRVELAYIMQQDIANAPELRNYYASIPQKFKKPRVEYRVRESTAPNVTADDEVAKFFSGYDGAQTPFDVAGRVVDLLNAAPNPIDSTLSTTQPPQPTGASLSTAWQPNIHSTNQDELEALLRGMEDTQNMSYSSFRKRVATTEREWQAVKKQKAEEEARHLADVQARWPVGKTVTLGSYEQTPGRGKQAIEWQVLAAESNRVLLISKYLLEHHTYHPSHANVTWETCELRKWLNNTFLHTAFNAAEQAGIAESRNQNPNNTRCGTPGGNATIDKLFLLSMDEVGKYLSSNDLRLAKATPQAKAHGVEVGKQDTESWYWLRSPGYYPYYASRLSNGSIDSYGCGVNSNGGGVRPAFWMKLEG